MKEISKEVKSKKRAFLGGTCNNSTWRNDLIPMLTVDYFNPVVEDWTPECQEREIQERKTADYVLYVLTPKMKGVYSIAEVVDDSNKRPEKTVFCVLPKDGSEEFDKTQLKSMEAVKKMIKENGGNVCEDLQKVADFLNKA